MSYASPFQLALFGTAPAGAKEGDRALPPAGKLEEEARALAFALSRNLHVPVRLAVTDNRSTMVSFRRGPSGLRLRIHHMFLSAPEPVVSALADYAGRGDEPAGNLLDEYIRDRQEHIRASRAPSAPELNPHGRCVDLQAIYEQLNAQHFNGKIAASIGWGRMPAKRRRKTIRLGVYDHQLREIRIHPALDNVAVPRFFVQFIVFHEMLHQLFPSTVRDIRRVHHPRAFRERERAFPLYLEALQWEKENLKQLLRK